jgi:PAS domain S-box-containing protein
MKILLVEEAAATRRRLTGLLEKQGHQVTTCDGLAQAKAALERDAFLLLILGSILPDENALYFCRKLRERDGGDGIFILMSADQAISADVKAALAAGANDYLTKPFQPDELALRLAVAENEIAKIGARRKTDATLEETTARVNEIVDKTSEGFFALDREWNVTTANAKAEQALGLDRAQLLGKNFWESFPALAGSAFEENCRKAMSEQSALQFETSVEGDLACFEVRAYPSSRGILIFFRDISDARRMKEQRLTANKLDSLGKFARGIAHDLNNALAVVSGKLRLAELEAPAHDGSLLGFIGEARSAARKAERLSGQLLIFANGEPSQKKLIPIAELVRKAAEFSLRGSELRAQYEIADDLARAEADPQQLEQIVHALVLNAREAVPNAGTIAIAAQNHSANESSGLPVEAGSYLKISIADRGPGVADESIAQIFQPYFTTKPDASGLGLAIANSLVKKQGGFLHLEKNSSAGATFSFYLPAISTSLGKEVSPPNENAESKRAKRVLVMDDEATIRELTAQLLATMNYDVTTVTEGEGAVRAYAQAAQEGRGFHAVLLDATVRGGLGGAETIARLREFDPNVNAIICSGYSDAAQMSEFLGCGFRAALPKPFTRRELAAVLEDAPEADAAAVR